MFNKWAGEGRWEVGEEAELHLQQYILTVKDKPTGLKDKESLNVRIELLTRSVQSFQSTKSTQEKSSVQVFRCQIVTS